LPPLRQAAGAVLFWATITILPTQNLQSGKRGEKRTQGKNTKMATILLLLISNIFMTFAWYGHLKYQNVPLWKVTLISWGIAFFEYCFQVPANRVGSHTFNAAQLKTIQEIITLVVFSGFSIWYLKQDIKWNYAVGFFFIVVAAFFIFKKW
jgi:uncharacterized protein (DUF486 family)